MFKSKRENKRKKGKKREKVNMDCQEIYPEINGVGLPYKMSSHVISIPSVNLI